MDEDITEFGAWMRHSSFALLERIEADTVNGTAMGDVVTRPPTVSATWLGFMVGTPNAGGHEGDRLAGTAALNYDPHAGRLDAAFSAITNIDCGTAHTVETVFLLDLAVETDGTCARGQSGARIQAAFYSPGNV